MAFSGASGNSRQRPSNRLPLRDEQLQLRVDPIHGDIDEHVQDLHQRVVLLKNVAQEIESETKYQNELLNQLEATMTKAQAGLKSTMSRLNRALVQHGSNHVLHVVTFALKFCGSYCHQVPSRPHKALWNMHLSRSMQVLIWLNNFVTSLFIMSKIMTITGEKMQSLPYVVAAMIVFGILFFIVSPGLDVLLQKQSLQLFLKSGTVQKSNFKYFQGLLPVRTGDQCHSRLQHHLYRRSVSNYTPSDYLIQRLRQYEDLHANCAHEAESISKIVLCPCAASLDANKCKFVVWVNYSGLGNKMITLVATFLYALLTDRILLIDRGTDMDQLFCEPFPTGSWLLPKSFPHAWLLELNETSPHKFGQSINRAAGGKCFLNVSSNMTEFAMISYAHLTHTYDSDDMSFFCEPQQDLLRRQVPWLFIKSNEYFVPSLYFMPSFNAELEKLFPQQEATFHHLGRYLLHPSNAVWGRTTRFYDTYLADANILVGLQIRLMHHLKEVRESYLSRVFQCAVEKNILPNVTYVEKDAEIRTKGDFKKSIAAVITSLDQLYFDRLRDLYLKYSTKDGSRVSLHMPSHEGWQQTGHLEHDQKALMEIYLLSLCDVLFTSPSSTFGYVAQGLAGLRAWLMRRMDDSDAQDACSRVTSVDPCFHAPAAYDCDCQGSRDAKTVLDNVQQCEDVPWGIQLKAANLSI